MRRKYRDRHGRGIRGFLLDPALPAWRTRADKFDDLIAAEFAALNEHLGGRLADLDVAVLDVPESDPAPWEDGIPLARFLPFDRGMGKRGRLIFYRRPIETAAQRSVQPRLVVHDVVVDQVASVLGERAEDIDYF